MQNETDSPLGGPLDLPEDATHGSPLPTHKPPRKTGKIIVVILFILLLLGGGAFAFIKLRSGSTETQSTAQEAPQTDTAESQASTSDVVDVATTKDYTNDVMRFSVSYPTTWTVTPGTGGFRVESPDFSYRTLDKGTVTGNFRIYVRQGARQADGVIIGRGVATMPSEKLVYAAPTASQRKDTNLSFFGLDKIDNFAFFLIAGNFSLKQGDTLGPNYGKEPDTYIIVGGYSAKSLEEDLAMNKVSTETFQTTKAYKQAIDILKSIKIQ